MHAPDVLDSLAFYRALGFTEVDTSDIWDHKYAVVTDGDISIGLHEHGLDAPNLTFVQPDLAGHARNMSDSGYDFSRMRIDEDVFNEIAFSDRDGHTVRMVEARTSLRAAEPPEDSLCGRWLELSLPVRDAMHAAIFWAPLAPAILSHREEPTPQMRFDAGGLALALSESIALKRPSLCFKCADREPIERAIEQHGIRHEKFPGYEGAFVMLRAPEGTELYVFDEDFLGESIEVIEGTDEVS